MIIRLEMPKLYGRGGAFWPSSCLKELEKTPVQIELKLKNLIPLVEQLVIHFCHSMVNRRPHEILHKPSQTLKVRDSLSLCAAREK